VTVLKWRRPIAPVLLIGEPYLALETFLEVLALIFKHVTKDWPAPQFKVRWVRRDMIGLNGRDLLLKLQV
jgi:hypothetical protein